MASSSKFLKSVSDKGSKKMLGFVGVAIVAAVGYGILGSDPEVEYNSTMRTAPESSGNTNTTNVDENYERALKDADSARISDARDQGKSALPSIIGTSVEKQDVVPLNLEAPKIVRPTVATTQEVKPVVIAPPQASPQVAIEPVRPVTAQTQTQSQAGSMQPSAAPEVQLVERPEPEIDQNMVAAYQQKMSELITKMEAQPTAPTTSYFYNPPAPQAQSLANAGQQAAGNFTGTSSSSLIGSGVTSVPPTQQAQNVIDQPNLEDAGPQINMPLPGSILYASIINEANSDVPGPVVARLLQGEYSGSKLIGQFAMANDKLIIEFNGISIEKDASGAEINEYFPINSVAVGVDKLQVGLASDVDRHLMQRIGITFATAFIGGYGSAIAESGQTTVSDGENTSTSNPIYSAADQVKIATGAAATATGAAIMEGFGNRGTTVKVFAGTPIGVLFLPTSN